MADPTARVPDHDLSHEPERSKFNAEGWDQEGDNQGAAMVLDKRDSTSTRVEALMASGMEEKDAQAQAVSELEQKLEGKTADVETYIKLFSKVSLTAEDVKSNKLEDPSQTESHLPFTARAILYPDEVGNGEFLLRYGANDGSIKEVRIKFADIASVKSATDDLKRQYPHSIDPGNTSAYRNIKGELQRLGFKFEKPGAGIGDKATPYDQNVSDAISRKIQASRSQAVEDARKRFDF